jgi:endonuclease YncB( thermonuclease family)
LRLRAISAAELDTAEGKKSSAVLSKVLKNVEFLVIKTSKTDIYGRYVADVFFAQGKTSEKLDDLQKIADEGIYLNQLLLDLGAVEIF